LPLAGHLHHPERRGGPFPQQKDTLDHSNVAIKTLLWLASVKESQLVPQLANCAIHFIENTPGNREYMATLVDNKDCQQVRQLAIRTIKVREYPPDKRVHMAAWTTRTAILSVSWPPAPSSSGSTHKVIE